jgi:RNA polymerase sigma factor (sigma-70 family)
VTPAEFLGVRWPRPQGLDADVVARAASGDRRAQNEVAVMFTPTLEWLAAWVLRLPRRRPQGRGAMTTAKRELQADLVQEGHLAVFRKLPAWRPNPESGDSHASAFLAFAAWMAMVEVVKKASRPSRGKKVTESLDALMEPVTEDEPPFEPVRDVYDKQSLRPDELLDTARCARALESLVGSLPDPQVREVARARFIDRGRPSAANAGKSRETVGELAARLEVTERQVGRMQERAASLLREEARRDGTLALLSDSPWLRPDGPAAAPRVADLEANVMTSADALVQRSPAAVSYLTSRLPAGPLRVAAEARFVPGAQRRPDAEVARQLGVNMQVLGRLERKAARQLLRLAEREGVLEFLDEEALSAAA